MKRLAAICIAILCICSIATAQDKDKTPTISEKTEGLEKHEGYFTYYWDEAKGKVWLEIDKLNKEFLYINSLTAGIGSNDIGLDRNQLGDDRVVYFEKRGPKVLMIQPNYSYRAITENQKEKESVKDAFARSVLWGFEISAQENDKYLVDATNFLMQDAHGVADRLKSGGQGTYRLDDSRSALYKEGTMNFPKNTEFEALLTFTGDASGYNIRSVTPSSDAVTVRQHHSFVQLPDDNYEPRVFDPRAGYYGTSFQDYSTPIEESLTKRFITRHRLEKKNPNAEMSEPVEPIVYYLDPGTPEPVRSALLDGARWWNQAFEAAGYKNAFRVKMLPDDAHPLDVRYNIINWVHRSTRGWSYGSSVVDPRTGEIIKGHVLLGSLRVRQDYLIAEGLLSPYKDGVNYEDDDPMLKMALARIRQLSAHEVGHTLGIAHNFAASTNSRASVMDYPAPKVNINNGKLDLSEAYDTGIGEWDKVSVAYGYQDFPKGTNEKEGLDQIINNAIGEGLLFISDSDARPQGGAHPKAHLWDNGQDAVDQLGHVMDVRDIALQNFSESNIKKGMPMATLEDVLVPMYLYHRYQIEGTVKLIGGVDYTYKLRGDSQKGPEPVSVKKQRAALDAMLSTISVDALRMPQKIIDIIPPRPIGYYGTRELFNSYTDPAFDPLGAAETAADMSAQLLFNPNRAARLVEFKARNSNNLGFAEMVEEVMNSSWKRQTQSGYEGAVQRAVNFVVLYNLIQLAMDDNASNQVRAIAHAQLKNLQTWLSAEVLGSEDAQWQAAYRYGLKMIDDYENNPERIQQITPPLSPPPGSPIGSGHAFLECGL
ncbi:MAG: zinc-dependent metalloprotease [Balneolaceae bacterium]|nr:zinc-dependent metalloprotease [Balneolaceae bacterium]